MKYICQLDYPDTPYITHTSDPDYPSGKDTTVASSACGLCSAMMVVDRLRCNAEFSLEDAIALSYEKNANHSFGTDYKIFAPALAERFRLRLETSCDPDRLRYCLRTGGAAVVHCGGDHDDHKGSFAHVGHYIAAISEQEDGRICLMDPDQYPGKYAEPDRGGQVEEDGHICICEMSVLMGETDNRNPRFYLFWRK